jgi:hypothetical protein
MLEMGRRTFAKLTGVAAAAASIPAAANVPLAPNTIRLNDGSIHPVSPEWYQRNVVGARVMRENERRRLAILELSNEHPLSAHAKAELAALTDFKNVNRAYALMERRDYREVFGPDATVDQIHHNRVQTTCGCVLNFIFDHNNREGAGLQQHPHYPTAVCDAHAYLAGDFKAHFSTVVKG